jgi:hypothetical protein
MYLESSMEIAGAQLIRRGSDILQDIGLSNLR